MLVQDYISNSAMEKKYYIKRKLIKDEALIYNGSIFPSSEDQQSSKIIEIEESNKHHTLTTDIQRTVTVNSHHEVGNELLERGRSEERSEMLPKIYTTSQSKYSRHSCWQVKSKQKQRRNIVARQKVLNSHITDPLYLRLQKTLAKRVSNNFKHYKRGWIDSSLRRKGKSVVDSSLQKAASTIENINADAMQRKTTVRFTANLRNNQDEKKFIFPAKMRPNIQGLKGRGGRIFPAPSSTLFIEEVLKHHRGKSLPSE